MTKTIPQLARQIAATRPALPAVADRPRRTFPITELEPDGQRYWRVRVEVDAAFDDSLVRPSQYTTFKLGELDPRFLVIASAPGRRRWEFLIDRDSTIGRALVDGAPGEAVTLSRAEGDGFAITPSASTPLLGFATGAGVATLKPVFDLLLEHAPARLERAALYYGEVHARDFALADDLARWRDAGATVMLAREDLGDTEQGWRYVQDAFAAHGPVLEGARVMLSGAPVMMRMVSEQLMRQGVAREALLTNI